MTDDPRVAQLQDQLLRERARAHDAMNALQARIAELEVQVRDFRTAADTATREATELRREAPQLRSQPAERHPQSEREREQRLRAEIREVSSKLCTAAERLRYFENAEFAQTGTEGVPEADSEEKNPDGFYFIGQVGTDVEFILSDTAEIPRLETVEHTGRGGFVNTDYGMTLAGIDGSNHPVYGEFRNGYLFRVVIDMTSDFRDDGLLPE